MTSLQHQESGQILDIRRNSRTHYSFLATKTISHVLAHVKASKRQLLDLPETATFEQAFALLLAEDILSVPVYQSTGPDETKTYVAIVGVLDLMKRLNHDNSDIHFFQYQLKLIIGETDTRLVSVQSSDALIDVLSLLTQQGAYQVLVKSNDNQPATLLSQIDILRYLQFHNHQLGSILDQTVPQLVTKSQEQVTQIAYKTTAFNAFAQLDPLINALPIVDDEGYLVGEIGSQDLRGLNKTHLQELSKPVLRFLKSSRGGLVAPLTCHSRFTLSQLMTAFVLRKTDRLWWIDQGGHIQGVITPINIINAMLK